MTTANSSQATTGNAKSRDDPRVEDRQDPAPARLGRAGPQEQRDRAGEQQQRRRDEGQQQVLDHVHRRTASCRSARSPSPARRAAATTPRTQDTRPPAGARDGRGGAGRPAGRRSRHSEQRADRRQPDQRVERPADRRSARVGGSVGTRAAVGRGRTGRGEQRRERRRRRARRPGAGGPGVTSASSRRSPRVADDGTPGRGRPAPIAPATSRARTFGYDRARPAPPLGAARVPGRRPLIAERPAHPARHISRNLDVDASPVSDRVRPPRRRPDHRRRRGRRRSSCCGRRRSRRSGSGTASSRSTGQAPVTDRGARRARPVRLRVLHRRRDLPRSSRALIVWTVFRYRRKAADDDLPPQTHGNNLVEVIWTVIPTVIVLFLFVMSWQTLNTVDAKAPTDVHVRAVAAQFQWQFDYLDGRAAPTRRKIAVHRSPAGRRGRRHGPPGRRAGPRRALSSPTSSTPSTSRSSCSSGTSCRARPTCSSSRSRRPGTYRGQCAELCGTGHGAMLFDVHARARARTTTPGSRQRSRRPTRRRRPAPSGEPAGPGASSSTAQNIAFTTHGARRRPADAPFTIHFHNRRRGVPHNVEIKDADGGVPFKGEHHHRRRRDATTQCRRSPPARIHFICTVHPNMTGTLTVQ